MKVKNPRRTSLIGSRVTSVLSISMVLVVAGLCAVLGIAVRRAAGGVGDNTTVLMSIVPGTDPLRVSEIKRTLNDAPWSEKYTYTDANNVLVNERELMDEDSRRGLELLDENPFGDEFLITIAEGWRSADSLTAVTKRLEAMDDVDMVVANSEIIGNANDGLGRVLLCLGVFGLILLAISLALIISTVSLAIYSRRFTIYTMKLVGATNSFIRRPFVRSGMWNGMLAGVIAAVVVLAVTYYASVHEPMFAPYLTWTDGAVISVALVAMGALICRGAAWWVTTRYLRARYDRLFKK